VARDTAVAAQVRSSSVHPAVHIFRNGLSESEFRSLARKRFTADETTRSNHVTGGTYFDESVGEAYHECGHCNRRTAGDPVWKGFTLVQMLGRSFVYCLKDLFEVLGLRLPTIRNRKHLIRIASSNGLILGEECSELPAGPEFALAGFHGQGIRLFV
jgi:hypothetical protein